VCSYYPVVDNSADEGQSWADDLPEVEQEEQLDDRHPLLTIPAWFWIMIGGVLGITFLSVGIRFAFPDEDGPRGAIALLQVFAGFVSFATCHGIACRKAFALDRRLNPMDILLGWVLIWQPTIQELPKTCKRIWGLVWGITAMLTAVAIIGGIDYSAPFRIHTESPLKDINPLKAVGAAAQVAKAATPPNADQPQDMDEAMGQLTGKVDESGLLPEGAMDGDAQASSMDEALGGMTDAAGGTGVMDGVGGVAGQEGVNDMVDALESGDLDAESIQKNFFDRPKRLETWIYGLEIDSKRMPSAFLFAAEFEGKQQHVARIETKNLPRDKFRTMALRLSKVVRKTPAIETAREAIWVERAVHCELNCDAYDANNEMVAAVFKAIIINQRGSRD